MYYYNTDTGECLSKKELRKRFKDSNSLKRNIAELLEEKVFIESNKSSRQLQKKAWEIVKSDLNFTIEGCITTYFDKSLSSDKAFTKYDLRRIAEYIRSYEQVESAEVDEEEFSITVNYYLDYCKCINVDDIEEW